LVQLGQAFSPESAHSS